MFDTKSDPKNKGKLSSKECSRMYLFDTVDTLLLPGYSLL